MTVTATDTGAMSGRQTPEVTVSSRARRTRTNDLLSPTLPPWSRFRSPEAAVCGARTGWRQGTDGVRNGCTAYWSSPPEAGGPTPASRLLREGLEEGEFVAHRLGIRFGCAFRHGGGEIVEQALEFGGEALEIR